LFHRDYRRFLSFYPVDRVYSSPLFLSPHPNPAHLICAGCRFLIEPGSSVEWKTNAALFDRGPVCDLVCDPVCCPVCSPDEAAAAYFFDRSYCIFLTVNKIVSNSRDKKMMPCLRCHASAGEQRPEPRAKGEIFPLLSTIPSSEGIADGQVEHHIADICSVLEVPLGALSRPGSPEGYRDVNAKDQDGKIKA